MLVSRHDAPGRGSTLGELPYGFEAVDPKPLGTAPSRPAHAVSRQQSATVGEALLRTARPRQWLKNLLVLAAPASAGALGRADVLFHTSVAFVVFTLAASGTYFLNDTADVAEDRRHPVKRLRPIAAGQIPVPVARALGIGLMLLAGAGAWLASGPPLAVIVAAYLVVTVGYTTWLRDVAVLDISAVALGFVLRAVSGGVAAPVPLSDWFLIVVSFGALFLAAGKRFAELRALGSSSATRATMATYNEAFLRHVTFAAATIAILGYCAWTFARIPGSTWLTVSIFPLVVGLLRYALLLEEGEGEAPEEILLHDRALQVLGALWGLAFWLGIYW